MNLKIYNQLSNIETRIGTPCYLHNPRYFADKLGAADNKSYLFLHNKKFMDRFCYFFDCMAAKPKIKEMIRKKCEDNEILNEINDMLKPAYPDYDKILQTYGVPANLGFIGADDFLQKRNKATVHDTDIIIVGNIRGTIPPSAKKIYNIGLFTANLAEINFIKFLDTILLKLGFKAVLEPNIIRTPREKIEHSYTEKNIKKNPLKVTLQIVNSGVIVLDNKI
jgi:hypothetical protein